MTITEGVEAFCRASVEGAPLMTVRTLYLKTMVPLIDALRETRGTAEAGAVRQSLADALLICGTVDEPSAYYVLPAHMMMLFDDPASWVGFGARETRVPSAALIAGIDGALRLTQGQRANPYRDVLLGVRTYLSGDVYGAFDAFAAARDNPQFAHIVRDHFRGASTCRPLSGIDAILTPRRAEIDSVAVGPVVPVARPHWCADGALPVLLFTGDAVYFRAFALAIVESLAEHCSGPSDVAFHIIDYEPDTCDGVLEALNALGAQHHFTITLTAETSPERSRPYYATARFFRLAELLALFERPVLLSDMDCVFTADPWPVFSNLVRPDAVRLLCPGGGNRGYLPWRSVWAGHLYVPAGANGMAFATLLGRLCCYLWPENPNMRWWVDQNALGLAHYFCALHHIAPVLTDDFVPGRYIRSGMDIKVSGLRRIPGIAASMDAGANWNEALRKLQM